MATRAIRCVCTTFGMPETLFMTQRRVVEERNRLCRKAEQMHKEIPDAQHIVYYWDERDDEGQIINAHLYYTPIVLNEQQFDERTRRVNGLIGSVHRHE